MTILATFKKRRKRWEKAMDRSIAHPDDDTLYDKWRRAERLFFHYMYHCRHSISLAIIRQYGLLPKRKGVDFTMKFVMGLGGKCPQCCKRTPCDHYHADYFCPVCTLLPCKCDDPDWFHQETG